MSASWLKIYLAPIRFLVNSIAQIRDDRVNFRNGFTSSQVPDADGINVLTIDVSTSNTSYEPTPSTIPIRNGSGTLKGATITATSFTYSSPKTITFREPVRAIEPALFDPVTGWSINSSLELETNAASLQWQTELALVPGSTLTSLSVVYTPNNAHAGLPSDQPSIELFYIDYGGTPTLIDTVQDSAANLTEYQARRTLTLTLSPEVAISANRRYVLQFNSETGTNSLGGLALHAPAIWTAKVTTIWA